MKSFYVYAHVRKDTNQVFYIGQGQVKDKRAWSQNSRNKHWKNIVTKAGFTVKILSYWDTRQESCQEEIRVIKEYKEKGILLVNMTHGGEGKPGHKMSEETRKRMGDERTGDKNPMFGKKLSDEHKKKIGQAQKGEKHHSAQPIFVFWNDNSASEFSCQKHLAEYLNVSCSSICNWIKGKTKIPVRYEIRKIKSVGEAASVSVSSLH